MAHFNQAGINPGDNITAMGYTFTVARVLYSYKERIGYDVEFIDSYGGYHHWKQWYDGGELIRQS